MPDFPLGPEAQADAWRPYQFQEVFLFALASAIKEKPRRWLPTLSSELLRPQAWRASSSG